MFLGGSVSSRNETHHQHVHSLACFMISPNHMLYRGLFFCFTVVAVVVIVFYGTTSSVVDISGLNDDGSNWS